MSLHESSCPTPAHHAGQDPAPPAPVLTPMPEAVTSFGAVSHHGWLYVYGGHKGERHQYSAPMVSGAFHRIRFAEGAHWEKLPDAPPAQGISLAAHGDFIYRIGGMAARNAPGEKSDLHSHATVARYDVRQHRWEDGVPLPEPRSSHDAVVLGDKLYVAGGWTLAGSSSQGAWATTLLELDLRASAPRWVALPQPFQRRALALAGLGDSLYCLGGIDSNGDTQLAVEIFNTRTRTWTAGPSLPPGPMDGFGCAAAAQAGRVWFSGLKGELHALEPAGSAWSFVAHLKHARFFHRLVPAGSTHLIAAGGEDGERKRNDLEVIALPTAAPAPANPRPR